MLRFFHWQVLRYISRHRFLALLNVLSVALGVAVYLAIQLANQSASRAFAATIEVIAGKAQLQITAPANDLPDRLFPLLQKTNGISAATPLVRGLVTLPAFPGEYLDILGVDIFTNTPFRTFQLTNFSSNGFDIESWLRGPATIALTQSFASRHGLKRGDKLRIQVNGQEHEMNVAFIMDGSVMGELDEHFAAMDIGWAQELFTMRGRLSSVELQIDRNANRPALIERLQARLPGNVEVAAPARRSEQIDKMLSSFQLNLAAMSLVSLFVGAFLIFNVISASVVRRRREIGILRSLGVSPAQIGAIFLGEAMISAVIGTLLGLLFGTLLAHSLVGIVSRTISSLYVLVNVRSVATNWSSYAGAAALGLAVALLATLFPARAAAKMAPIAALHPEVISEKNESVSRGWLAIGCLAFLGAIATSCAALYSGPAWLSFVAAFFCLAGASCFAPSLVIALAVLTRAIVRPKARAIEPQVAALALRRSLIHNSVNIAALAAAVAMTIGVSVMIFSFRQTVNAWINQTLVADLFVTPASNELLGPSSFLPPEVISFFDLHPAVAAVDTFRHLELPFRDGRMSFAAIRADGPRTFAFVGGNNAESMRRFRNERCVIVSESFARRQRLKAGDNLEVATPVGRIQLPIAAIFYDYTHDEGVVFTSAQNFAELFHDGRVNSVGVYLKQGADFESVSADFRKRFGGHGEFAIFANRALRARIFEIFDQTFAVTYVLRAIAVIVAIAGIFLSFTTLILERTRTLGIMRALGISRPQLRRIVIWESMLVGIAASVLGICSGMGVAVILSVVVNRAFFGWTIRLEMPWPLIVTTPLWILTAAIIAAIWPAIRASRLNLASVLRTE